MLDKDRNPEGQDGYNPCGLASLEHPLIDPRCQGPRLERRTMAFVTNIIQISHTPRGL